MSRGEDSRCILLLPFGHIVLTNAEGTLLSMALGDDVVQKTETNTGRKVALVHLLLTLNLALIKGRLLCQIDQTRSVRCGGRRVLVFGVNPTVSDGCTRNRDDNVRGIDIGIVLVQNVAHHARNVMPRVAFPAKIEPAIEDRRAIALTVTFTFTAGEKDLSKELQKFHQEIMKISVHLGIVLGVGIFRRVGQTSSHRLVDVQDPRWYPMPGMRVGFYVPSTGVVYKAEGSVFQKQPVHG
mmetsp:Transcript_10212/g.24090  ORF Transcript_10212/g.24090 Transcript_10212/m.24090 type:complete len:239 (-) Transcript_10212:362-1078(-)